MKYLILLLLLAGCYTEKKAVKQADKAIKKFPKQINENFRKQFPCVITKMDTIVNYDWVKIDTTLDVTVISPDVECKHKQGSNIKTIKKTISIPQKTVTIIEKIKDSSEIFQCQLLLEESTIQKNDLLKIIDEQHAKIGGLKKWKLWLIIPYLVFVTFFVLSKIWSK